MTYFRHNKINHIGNFLIGTTWNFRSCFVEMFEEGFTCTCKKRPVVKCNHIKSVELGLMGVGQIHNK